MTSEDGLDHSKRRFLKTGVGLLGAGALGSTAGCLLSSGGGGSGTYTDWTYEPGTIQTSNHYTFNYVKPRDFTEVKDLIGDKAYESITAPAAEYLGYAGLDPGSVGMNLSYEGINIVSDFNTGKKQIVNELKKKGWEKGSDHEGYSIYTKSQESVSVGINDAHLVFAHEGVLFNSAEVVQTVINTKKGESARYVKNKDFKVLTSKLGKGSSVQARTHDRVQKTSPNLFQFEGQVGFGNRYDVDGKTTSLLFVYVFENEETVATDDIKSAMASIPYEITDLSTSKDGRIVTVDGEVRTKSFFGGVRRVRNTVPKARLDFDQSGSSGEKESTITITHRSGDSIDNRDGETLVVEINGERTQKQFPDEKISPEYSLEIDISQYSVGDTVRVIWLGIGTSQILADYELM